MSYTTDNIRINRKYKDRLFRILFTDKKHALELYNALNHSDYKNEDESEIRTLEDVVWIKMKNDLAFLIRDVLALYEHQSTLNPNMPVRGFLYFADLFRGILKDKNPYGTKLIPLPTPVYIVFYNGNEEIGEEKWLKLSDAFICGNEQSKMELQVQVLNINYGHNKQLMERCPTLCQYAILIGRIKKHCEQMAIEDAVQKAVNECIKEGVLAEFLSLRRAEIMDAFLTGCDEEKVLEAIGQERYEDGKISGKIDSIFELLGDLGTIPDELKNTIRRESDLLTLTKWLKLAAKSDSIDSFISQM